MSSLDISILICRCPVRNDVILRCFMVTYHNAIHNKMVILLHENKLVLLSITVHLATLLRWWYLVGNICIPISQWTCMFCTKYPIVGVYILCRTEMLVTLDIEVPCGLVVNVKFVVPISIPDKPTSKIRGTEEKTETKTQDRSSLTKVSSTTVMLVVSSN